MNIRSLLRSALSSSCALLLTLGGASLAHAALIQRMPDGFFAAVPKSWGQCRWEGGLGVADSCKLEDCPEDGGKADCTDPEIVPPNGRPWSDADPEGFIYGMCDEFGPYVIRDRTWCEAAGGTWNGPTDCANLPDVVVGGGGTSVKDEAASETIAQEFERRVIGGCGGPSPSPTPWAVNTTGSLHCWNGPRVQRNDKILSDMRYTDYLAPQSGSLCDQGPREERVYFRRDRDLACPVGYTRRDKFDGDLQCVRPMSDYCPTLGNPVAPISGAKLQTETDYRTGGIGGLEFVRYYNSQGYFRARGENSELSAMGERWRHSYQRSLHFYADQTYALGAAKRANGTVLFFDAAGEEIHNRGGGAARLVEIDPPSGTPAVSWQLTLVDDSVESYDASGKLLSIRTRAGLVTTMGWTSGKLTSVTDAFGRSLSLSYGTNGRIQTLTQPDSQAVGYVYDDDGRLIFATYPGSTAREYHYELASPYRYLLTGITDENETRYATFAYYGGFATGTQHAGGIDNYQFVYNGASTTVTDPLGTVRTYTYAFADGVRKITGLSQPCARCRSGNAQTTAYDTNGNVTSRIDFNGNRTNYTLDATRNLETSRTEGLTSAGATTAVTRTITTTWHSTFRLPATLTEPDGNGGTRVTTFTYDSDGNLIEKEITAGSLTRIWTYTYDSYGRLLTTDGPRTDVNDVTTYTYYPDNDSCSGCRGQLHTVTNALGQTKTYAAYDANGHPLRVLDANGIAFESTYTPRGWRATQRADADGVAETATTQYDEVGNSTRHIRADGSHFEIGYDDAHRQNSVIDPLGNVVYSTFDSGGAVLGMNTVDATSRIRQTNSRTYDNIGRLAGQIGAYGETARRTYDGNGNRVSELDADGGLTTYTYDARNRLVAVVDPQGATATLTYDPADQLRQVVNGSGLATTYAYDGLGNRVSVSSPETGLSQMTFDAAGNEITRTDARGVVVTMTYDVLDRVTQSTHGAGLQAVTNIFGYDAGAYGLGRLTSTSRGDSQTAYEHDTVGRVVTRTETVGSASLETAYTYALGRVVSMRYPSGTLIEYSHDANGKISGIDVSGQPLIDAVDYEPFGPASEIRFANTSTVRRSFDLNRKAVELTLRPASGVAAVLRYDAKSRLTRADIRQQHTASYFYDSNGNRSARSIDGAGTSYAYGIATGRLESVSGAETGTYTYDSSGNLLTYNSIALTHDAQGNVSGSTSPMSATYGLNAWGERVQKVSGSAITLFAYNDQGLLIGEYEDASTPLREYIYLNGIPVAVLVYDTVPAPTIHIIYADALATPRAVEDFVSQEIVWRWDIDGLPFGESAPDTDPDADGTHFELNLRFPGQYYDAETGLSYNHNRYYAAFSGRYTQSDPIGLDGGLNGYAYAYSNPLRYSDPEGLLPCWTTMDCDCRKDPENCPHPDLPPPDEDCEPEPCEKKTCSNSYYYSDFQKCSDLPKWFYRFDTPEKAAKAVHPAGKPASSDKIDPDKGSCVKPSGHWQVKVEGKYANYSIVGCECCEDKDGPKIDRYYGVPYLNSNLH